MHGTAHVSSSPLYYQAVRRDSATNSGIALLALMLSTVVFVIISGQLVARIGRYWPLLIIGPILQAVGGGLLYTIAPGSSNGGLIGIQICLGIGIGLTLQVRLEQPPTPS